MWETKSFERGRKHKSPKGKEGGERERAVQSLIFFASLVHGIPPTGCSIGESLSQQTLLVFDSEKRDGTRVQTKLSAVPFSLFSFLRYFMQEQAFKDQL